ncbi:MAG: trypsin-like peptidase domain-containing protein [Bacteroidota bacterium]
MIILSEVQSDTLKKLTVRIDQRGSGVLYHHPADTEFLYIFTAKHCLQEQESSTISESISIQFKENNQDTFVQFEVKRNAIIEDEEQDFALIKVSKKELSNEVHSALSPDSLPEIKIIKDVDTQFPFFARGYPQLGGEGADARQISARFIETDRQLKVVRLIDTSTGNSTFSAAVDLWQGMSGSGVFMKDDNGTLYLDGILIELVDSYGSLNDFKYYSLQHINLFFEKKEIPSVEIAEMGKEPSSNQRYWGYLTPEKDLPVEFPEKRMFFDMDKKLSEFRNNIRPDHLFYITGFPGTGKTQLLAHSLRNDRTVQEINEKINQRTRILFLDLKNLTPNRQGFLRLLLDVFGIDKKLSPDEMKNDNDAHYGNNHESVKSEIVRRLTRNMSTSAWITILENIPELEEEKFKEELEWFLSKIEKLAQSNLFVATSSTKRISRQLSFSSQEIPENLAVEQALQSATLKKMVEKLTKKQPQISDSLFQALEKELSSIEGWSKNWIIELIKDCIEYGGSSGQWDKLVQDSIFERLVEEEIFYFQKLNKNGLKIRGNNDIAAKISVLAIIRNQVTPYALLSKLSFSLGEFKGLKASGILEDDRGKLRLIDKFQKVMRTYIQKQTNNVQLFQIMAQKVDILIEEGYTSDTSADREEEQKDLLNAENWLKDLIENLPSEHEGVLSLLNEIHKKVLFLFDPSEIMDDRVYPLERDEFRTAIGAESIRKTSKLSLPEILFLLTEISRDENSDLKDFTSLLSQLIKVSAKANTEFRQKPMKILFFSLVFYKNRRGDIFRFHASIDKLLVKFNTTEWVGERSNIDRYTKNWIAQILILLINFFMRSGNRDKAKNCLKLIKDVTENLDIFQLKNVPQTPSDWRTVDLFLIQFKLSDDKDIQLLEEAFEFTKNGYYLAHYAGRGRWLQKMLSIVLQYISFSPSLEAIEKVLAEATEFIINKYFKYIPIGEGNYFLYHRLTLCYLQFGYRNQDREKREELIKKAEVILNKAIDYSPNKPYLLETGLELLLFSFLTFNNEEKEYESFLNKVEESNLLEEHPKLFLEYAKAFIKIELLGNQDESLYYSVSQLEIPYSKKDKYDNIKRIAKKFKKEYKKGFSTIKFDSDTAASICELNWMMEGKIRKVIAENYSRRSDIPLENRSFETQKKLFDACFERREGALTTIQNKYGTSTGVELLKIENNLQYARFMAMADDNKDRDMDISQITPLLRNGQEKWPLRTKLFLREAKLYSQMWNYEASFEKFERILDNPSSSLLRKWIWLDYVRTLLAGVAYGEENSASIREKKDQYFDKIKTGLTEIKNWEHLEKYHFILNARYELEKGELANYEEILLLAEEFVGKEESTEYIKKLIDHPQRERESRIQELKNKFYEDYHSDSFFLLELAKILVRIVELDLPKQQVDEAYCLKALMSAILLAQATKLWQDKKNKNWAQRNRGSLSARFLQAKSIFLACSISRKINPWQINDIIQESKQKTYIDFAFARFQSICSSPSMGKFYRLNVGFRKKVKKLKDELERELG